MQLGAEGQPCWDRGAVEVPSNWESVWKITSADSVDRNVSQKRAQVGIGLADWRNQMLELGSMGSQGTSRSSHLVVLKLLTTKDCSYYFSPETLYFKIFHLVKKNQEITPFSFFISQRYNR